MINIKNFENFISDEYNNTNENTTINSWVDDNISYDTMCSTIDDEFNTLLNINEGVLKDGKEKLYKWIIGIMKSISNKLIKMKEKMFVFIKQFFKIVSKVFSIDINTGKYLHKFLLSLMLIITSTATTFAVTPDQNEEYLNTTLDVCNAYVAYVDDVDKQMCEEENFVEAKIFFLSLRDFIQESTDSLSIDKHGLDTLDVVDADDLSKKAIEFIDQTKAEIERLHGSNRYNALKAEGKKILDYTYNRYTGDVVIYSKDGSKEKLHARKLNDHIKKSSKYEDIE